MTKVLYRSDNTPWHGHQTFAIEFVKLFRPSLLVELGTHLGDSYFSFCQGVAESGHYCNCAAIDSWEGDQFAGYYGSGVYPKVIEHNMRYPFSTLIKSGFDAAFARFTRPTIDLLHLDGDHTYEAVSHDFKLWKSKLSSRAVVLLHDTAITKGRLRRHEVLQRTAVRLPDL